MNRRLKVYFGACGVGLGHVTRSEAVAQELSQGGCEVLFSTYLDGLSYLDRTGWKHIVSPAISFRTREDGTIDTKLTATQNGVTVGLWKFAKQLIGEIVAIIRYNADVIISDTRLSTLLAGFILNRPRLLVINQYSVQMPSHPDRMSLVDRVMLAFARITWKYCSTMLHLVWGLSDIIVIPDFDMPLTISAYNLSIPRRVLSKVRFVGPLSTQKFRKEHFGNQRAKLRPKVFACISGPAADREHLVGILSTRLAPLAEKFDIVMSCGNPSGSSLPIQVGGMTVYEWMDRKDYEQTFQEADVVIGRAGHSTIMMGVTERKPLILIPPPHHTEQENNARRLEEMGMAEVLDQSTLDTSQLAAAIEHGVTEEQNWLVVLNAAMKAQNGTHTLTELVFALAHSSLENEVQLPAPMPGILSSELHYT